MFPLATTPELSQLRIIAGGVVWVAALLASLLALESLFRADVEDGTTEQWVLSGQPLGWLLLAKVAAHWVLTGLAARAHVADRRHRARLAATTPGACWCSRCCSARAR